MMMVAAAAGPGTADCLAVKLFPPSLSQCHPWPVLPCSSYRVLPVGFLRESGAFLLRGPAIVKPPHAPT